MGLLVLSLSVPEFYLTKDKSSTVDDQVERKTIEKVSIEENPRNYIGEFLEPHWGINLKRVGALLWQAPISKTKSLNYLLNI